MNGFSKEFINDCVEWDVCNWSRAINFWRSCDISIGGGTHVLDIGARGGGLSLLFASLGAFVECSDLISPADTAGVLHRKYGVDSQVTYRTLDALSLSEVNKYDIICLKSVLGGIGHNDNAAAQAQAIHNFYCALKPGGYLLIAENLTATRLHMFLRKRFNPWSNYWRYVTIEEMLEFCAEFSQVSTNCFGFLGAFGRTECQRMIFGQLDKAFDCFLPKSWHYIISVVALK